MRSRASHLDTGVLYCDDNLNRLSLLPSDSVDLIYLDPPFFSNRNYEVIWGDEAEVRSFEDRWDAGIDGYIDWLRHRVMEMHRVLKPSGSLYLHCDWHAGHYIKIMLDNVFGVKQFRNEIVWHYSGWNKKLADHYERRHDTIFFYGKARGQKFPGMTIPWESEEQYLKVRKQKRHVAADGRPFVMSDAGGGKRVERYLDEAMAYGRPTDDVWDLDKLNNSSAEALGYPTQKPEALLARVIAGSSEEGDVVLDPFCGCGTTVTVAQRMKRRWIGIDISPTAVNIMDRRLQALRPAVHATRVGLPETEEDLRALKPFEFQNWVMQTVSGTGAPRKTGDMGIDGYSFMVHDPIQVKQSDHVGRNVVDNFETAMRRNGSDKGHVIAFSFTTGAKQEVARARAKEGLDIHLITVRELLESKDEIYGPLAPPEAALIAMSPTLTPPATGSALPTVEELLASDRGTKTA
jgi:DNA modification methylase